MLFLIQTIPAFSNFLCLCLLFCPRWNIYKQKHRRPPWRPLSFARVPLCVSIACISFRLHLHLKIGTSKRFFGGHYKANKTSFNQIHNHEDFESIWISHDLTSSNNTLDLTITPFLGALGVFCELGTTLEPFWPPPPLWPVPAFPVSRMPTAPHPGVVAGLRFHETWLAGKFTINEVLMVENHL